MGRSAVTSLRPPFFNQVNSMILLPPPNLLRLVERTAELRALGQSWAQIAREIGRPYGTVNQWARRYRDFWDRVFARAARQASDEATAEAQAVLREMLRSENLELRQNAAKKLLDFRLPIE